jgi:hypothetical protein
MKIKSNGNGNGHGFPAEAGPSVEVAAMLADCTRCFCGTGFSREGVGNHTARLMATLLITEYSPHRVSI